MSLVHQQPPLLCGILLKSPLLPHIMNWFWDTIIKNLQGVGTHMVRMPQKQDTQTALVTCVLVSCTEAMQFRTQESMIHSSRGFGVIAEFFAHYPERNSSIKSLASHFIEDEMFKSLNASSYKTSRWPMVKQYQARKNVGNGWHLPTKSCLNFRKASKTQACTWIL